MTVAHLLLAIGRTYCPGWVVAPSHLARLGSQPTGLGYENKLGPFFAFFAHFPPNAHSRLDSRNVQKCRCSCPWPNVPHRRWCMGSNVYLSNMGGIFSRKPNPQPWAWQASRLPTELPGPIGLLNMCCRSPAVPVYCSCMQPNYEFRSQNFHLPSLISLLSDASLFLSLGSLVPLVI